MAEEALKTKKVEHPFVLTEVTPPRGCCHDLASELAPLARSDALCCAYLPGKSVRLPPEVFAHSVRLATGLPCVVNLGTRDMNRLALASRLLGIVELGISEVLVVAGDPFGSVDRKRGLQRVGDTTPTQLLKMGRRMAVGRDFRGNELHEPLQLRLGATLDPGRDPEGRLARRKVAAGARFLISQSIYEVPKMDDFGVPIYWGISVLTPGSRVYGKLPPEWKERLDEGNNCDDLTLDLMDRLLQSGASRFFLLPPILPGGARDYVAAGRVLERFRQTCMVPGSGGAAASGTAGSIPR
jgi:5,10-methylenetetrahydrofolate reductase